jgi:hypothetical protein
VIDIDSHPGRGTRMRLSMPLPLPLSSPIGEVTP